MSLLPGGQTQILSGKWTRGQRSSCMAGRQAPLQELYLPFLLGENQQVWSPVGVGIRHLERRAEDGHVAPKAAGAVPQALPWTEHTDPECRPCCSCTAQPPTGRSWRAGHALASRSAAACRAGAPLPGAQSSPLCLFVLALERLGQHRAPRWTRPDLAAAQGTSGPPSTLGS